MGGDRSLAVWIKHGDHVRFAGYVRVEEDGRVAGDDAIRLAGRLAIGHGHGPFAREGLERVELRVGGRDSGFGFLSNGGKSDEHGEYEDGGYGTHVVLLGLMVRKDDE